MSGYVPLTIEQWSTFSRIITVKNADGTPQNLVGFYANTSMRKSYYSNNPNTIQTTISDPANGEIILSLDASNTGFLEAGRYVYDVLSTAPGGTRTRLIEGIVVVTPGATH